VEISGFYTDKMHMRQGHELAQRCVDCVTVGCNGAWQVSTQDLKRVATCGVFHACQQ